MFWIDSWWTRPSLGEKSRNKLVNSRINETETLRWTECVLSESKLSKLHKYPIVLTIYDDTRDIHYFLTVLTQGEFTVVMIFYDTDFDLDDENGLTVS